MCVCIVGPFPFYLEGYVASVTVRDISAGKSLLTWQATFRTTDVEAATAGVTGIYDLAASTIAATVEPPPPAIDLFFIFNTRGTRVSWLLEELAFGYTHVVPSLGTWVAATDFNNRDLGQCRNQETPSYREPTRGH